MEDTIRLRDIRKAQPVGENRKRYKWNPIKLLRNVVYGILLLMVSCEFAIMLLWIADWWVHRPATF